MINNKKLTEKKPTPAFSKNAVPIVFCSNNNYVKYLSVAIQSIIDNSSEKYNYDILILHTEISKTNQALIESQFTGTDNFSCRFWDVNNFVSKINLKGKNHITKETFYRLLIIDILDAYQKAIYLDCDLVVDSDVANLFNIDVSKYYLGACRDIIGIGVIHALYGFIWKHRYKKLNLKSIDNYFNAGVLLMNISLMRLNFTSSDMLDDVKNNHWAGLDQDTLNAFCNKNAYLLDDKWNMINHRKHRAVIRHAPKEIYKRWKDSSRNPSIYHFAGPTSTKPWFNPFDYPAKHFWKYAYKTPFYQVIVDSMLGRTKLARKKRKMINVINSYISNTKNK